MPKPSNPLDEIREETLAILRSILRPGEKVALLDFPNHRNQGDHLIFLGEMAYLSRLGVQVNYVADPTRYSASDLRALVPDGTVLLHGGGSFGDRWLETQEFRERVISELHDRRIVQLPQGIEFSEGPLLQRAQGIFEAHPDLTLLIRDRASERETRRLFPKNAVLFCPDMALGYEPRNVGSPKLDIVRIRRQDSEGVTSHKIMQFDGLNSDTTDWGFTASEELKWKLLHVPGAVARRVPAVRRVLYPLQRLAYNALARLNVDSAIANLSRGRVVVADRLHATVLAALIGRPVVCVDNANGKVSAITNDYLSRMPGVYYTQSTEDAERVAVQLVGALD